MKNKVKILCVIVSCKKNEYLWNIILNKTFNSIIICGDPNLKTSFILKDRILYLKCNDNYDSLPEKTICMIRAFLSLKNFSNVSYILKIDDTDIYLNNKVNWNVLSSLNKKTIHYGGCKILFKDVNINWDFPGFNKWHYNKVHSDSYWYNREYNGNWAPWVNGGDACILSKYSLLHINEFTKNFSLEQIRNSFIYENVMIAYILYKNKIYPTETPQLLNKISNIVKPINNPLIVILSCKKNEYLWESLLNKTYNSIIFYADQELTETYIYKNRILCLKCNDYYDGLPEKILNMIRAILDIEQFSNITHIVKVDDWDTNFNNDIIPNINKILSTNNIDYGGYNICFKHCNKNDIENNEFPGDKHWHFGKISSESFWYEKHYKGKWAPWIDGGCGYILSRNAMEKIKTSVENKNNYQISTEWIYEDVMIGYLLYKCNIKPTQLPNFIEHNLG